MRSLPMRASFRVPWTKRLPQQVRTRPPVEDDTRRLLPSSLDVCKLCLRVPVCISGGTVCCVVAAQMCGAIDATAVDCVANINVEVSAGWCR